jgi:hypothetical protein
VSTVNAEQRALAEAVAGLLAKRSDSAAVRRAMTSDLGYDADLWQTMCGQIGVAGLLVPERFGGVGAGRTEVHLVLEQLGRTLTPSPMLGSAVLGAGLLLRLGDSDVNSRLLPGIADGSTIAAVCWADHAGRWGPLPVTESAGRVTASAGFVLDGDIADVLLVLGTDAVYAVDATAEGVRRAHTPALDLTRRLARVQFDAAPAARLEGDAAAAAHALRDLACVALSAEQVGAAARALELTVEYSKVRVQFGRPIGSFQALKHRMADLHVLVEAARSASYAAVDGQLAAAVAKAYCSEALFTVAAEAIQLHGGIAITWEHDAQLYFKRAHGGAALFGAPAEHVARMAVLAGIEDE